MAAQPVLIAGEWRPSRGTLDFCATNPATRLHIDETYPVSPWPELEEALTAAAEAFTQLRRIGPDRIAEFLEQYADRIDARRSEIVAKAHQETGLPEEPRLSSLELPRTTDQLRQAAAAARDRSWALPTIDTKREIRSMLGAIGPVCVFGPNNFPLAFNSIAGGDFAAAVAAGNPVVAKAHSSHPGTTRLLAEEAHQAACACEMPGAFLQLIYRADHEDGKRMVSHPLAGATGYTGAQEAGQALKQAADSVGKPIYLELGSINPVVILPGALRERGEEIVEQFRTSCLMGAGQFCTNPGLVLLLEGEESSRFVEQAIVSLEQAPVGTLVNEGVEEGMVRGVEALQRAGAELLTGGARGVGEGCRFQNTLLRIGGAQFLAGPEAFQREVFGNSSLLVVAADVAQLKRVVATLEGNLTGGIYSQHGAEDDALYDELAPILRQKVGRLLNDKMPTGVIVSPAMNHGGPYPATGHPGFTAVGLPAALRRFAMLQCFDNVREHRLPPELRDRNPTGNVWRFVDGQWTQRNL